MSVFVSGRGECQLRAEVHQVGSDLVVVLTGGNAPHVGCCVVAIPRPSLRDPARTSATASVINLVGHKDDGLARPMAEELASALKRVVVVTGGYHLDGASETQIAKVLDNAVLLTNMITTAFSGRH